jgi:hypothetical protein
VLVYTTQSTIPIAVIKNLHYDSINDMAWMKNKVLSIASSDGYCSFIRLDESVIGSILSPDSEAMPESLKEHYEQLNQVSFELKVKTSLANK